MVKWLRHHNFTMELSVRFRLGLIFKIYNLNISKDIGKITTNFVVPF
jgi:hypothetical protein